MNYIELTDEDREKWHKILEEQLGSGYDFDVVDKKLTECSEGWLRAPRLLQDRITRKFFAKPPTRIAAEKVPASFKGDDPIFSHLTEEEKKIWNKRYDEYMKDFAFNDSSDQSLLKQLLFEEILQHRCMISRLSFDGDRDAVEDELNNSVKRLAQVQKDLGINRDKRRDLVEDQSTDLTTLAMSLDSKQKYAERLNEAHEKEEEYFESEKAKKEPQNILPSLDSLTADDISIDVHLDPGVQDAVKDRPKPPKPSLENIGVKI